MCMSNLSENRNKDPFFLKLDDINAMFPKQLSNKIRPYFNYFHINRIKDFVPYVDAKEKGTPYRKQVTEFLLLTKGNSIRSKGLNKFDVKANSVFFVPAFQIRTSEFVSDDIDGYFCHFDNEIFNKIFFPQDNFKNFPFLQYIGTPLMEIPEADMKFITSLMEGLIHEYSKENIKDFYVVCSILMTLFHKFNSYLDTNQEINTKASILTQRYKNALMEQIFKYHTVAEFANLLSVSQNYLNQCVKDTTGKTALVLLTEMQLIEAKTLLRQSELNISEIAFKIADKNPSDFSRFFKANTGFTPRQFRDGMGY